MWRALVKWWKYVATKLHVLHLEHADPKVQLEQVIAEAREQHRRLTEQAANVIANQQQVERRVDRAVVELDKAEASAGQALLLADRERRSGDADRAARFEDAAESFAASALELRQEIAELEQALLRAASAADGAKVAVEQNAAVLRKRIGEKQRLLSKLDQAKMQEALNSAMEVFDGEVGADVPTFAEVEHKIDARLARAEARAQLSAVRVDPAAAHRLEVEAAQRSALAQRHLAEIRSSLGLASLAVEAVATERKAVGG